MQKVAIVEPNKPVQFEQLKWRAAHFSMHGRDLFLAKQSFLISGAVETRSPSTAGPPSG